jgi:hypothetical protein
MNGLAATSNFTLPLATLKEWQANRAPSPLEHLDSFQGSSLHPLTNDYFYPGLNQVANQTSLQKLDLRHNGDPLERGLTVAGPILGMAGATLLVLVKDGAIKANLIDQGEISPLKVKPEENSKTTCQIELPNGRQIGFYRGLNGASGISVSTSHQGATVSANFADLHQSQPKLYNVVAETSDEAAGQIQTQRVSMSFSEGRLGQVSLFREVSIAGTPGALKQELNTSHGFAFSDLGEKGSYVSPPSSEEMYLVAHSVMNRLPV